MQHYSTTNTNTEIILEYLVSNSDKNDAKAETPAHARSRLIGKDSDAGRVWGQEEKGKWELIIQQA